MNKLIRIGCFETNSSSSHSISICDKYLVYGSLYPNENGVIIIPAVEFGWEHEKYNDPETKAAYAFLDSYKHDLIKEVITEHTGAEEIKILDGGYIDHQSTGTFSCKLTNDIAEDKKIIKNFIFNKNSWLFTSNDNHEAEEDFYYVEKYRKNKIFPPKIRFKLKIEHITDSIKFLSRPTNKEISEKITSYFQRHFIVLDKENNHIDYTRHDKGYMFYSDDKSIDFNNKRVILKKETKFSDKIYYQKFLKFELVKC